MKYSVTIIRNNRELHKKFHNIDEVYSYVAKNLTIINSNLANSSIKIKEDGEVIQPCWKTLGQELISQNDGTMLYYYAIIGLIMQRKAKPSDYFFECNKFVGATSSSKRFTNYLKEYNGSNIVDNRIISEKINMIKRLLDD